MKRFCLFLFSTLVIFLCVGLSACSNGGGGDDAKNSVTYTSSINLLGTKFSTLNMFGDGSYNMKGFPNTIDYGTYEVSKAGAGTNYIFTSRLLRGTFNGNVDGDVITISTGTLSAAGTGTSLSIVGKSYIYDYGNNNKKILRLEDNGSFSIISRGFNSEENRYEETDGSTGRWNIDASMKVITCTFTGGNVYARGSVSGNYTGDGSSLTLSGTLYYWNSERNDYVNPSSFGSITFIRN